MTEVIQMRNNLARLREHQNEDERKLVIEENGVPLTLDEVFESLAKGLVRVQRSLLGER